MNNSYIKRKENIIICAIDILDELGIQGLTSKEIAKRQGITEPAVYKQFQGKQDIILNILDRFCSFDDMIRNTILEQKLSHREGILFYAKSYAEYYENYPQITTVMFSYDMYRYDPEINEKMMGINRSRYEVIYEMVKGGQASGEICGEISSEDIADMIIGLLWSTTFKWKTGGCMFCLKDKILSAIGYIIKN